MKFFVSTFFAASLVVSKAQELTLGETVATNEDLSTLATAIGLAGLEEYFTTTTDLTVFAPTNEALESIPANYLTPGFLPHLRSLLQYHVIEGTVVPSSDVTDGLTVETLNGESITATVNDAGVFFSGAAFTDAQVIIPDIAASNGIAHVVDQFFLPQSLTLSLYDLTGQVTGFESVLDLILQSGLEDELRADNRTVLAPSDTAFAALPSEFLEEVSANAELRDSIVLYHVIIGSYPQEIIVDGLEVMTASGNPLSFGVVGGGRFAQYTAIGPTNNVTFGVANLIASNGIAHTIDGVLEAPGIADMPTTGTDAPEDNESGETLAPTPASSTDVTMPETTEAPDEVPGETMAPTPAAGSDSTNTPTTETDSTSTTAPTTEVEDGSSSWIMSAVVALVSSLVAAML